MNRVRVSMAVALLLLVAGCSFGQKARDHSLLPAMRLASQGVEEDALAGVAATPEADRPAAAAQVAAFFASFSEDPPAADTRLLWGPVAAICEVGFEARLSAGTIGPGVATSLRERVTRFGEALSSYFREES